jgi:hypothetical protein
LYVQTGGGVSLVGDIGKRGMETSFFDSKNSALVKAVCLRENCNSRSRGSNENRLNLHEKKKHTHQSKGNRRFCAKYLSMFYALVTLLVVCGGSSSSSTAYAANDVAGNAEADKVCCCIMVFDYLLIHISPTKLDIAHFNSMLHRHT